MKKSHRKDVIIARIIFAVLCLLLLALIVWAFTWIQGKMAGDGNAASESLTESQQLPPVTENPDLPPVTEYPEEPQATESTEDAQDENTYVWTNNGVNMRTEPNVNCEVITVLNAGTKLTLLGEEDGWVLVSYNGQDGYVSTDYITDTNPSEEGAE